MIPGVDQALTGMAPGDDKKVTVAADQAYGPHRDELIHEVGRERLSPEMRSRSAIAWRVPTPTADAST